MHLILLILFLPLTFIMHGCSLYSVKQHSEPEVLIPEEFYNEGITLQGEHDEDLKSTPYWTEFQDNRLNIYMDEVIEKNFSLQEAGSRVTQAMARAQVAGAGRFPAVDVQFGGSRTRIETGETIITNGVRPVGDTYQNNFFLRNGLSFELDIWQRVANGYRAQNLRVEQVIADYENSELILSQALFQRYLEVKEGLQLTRILDEQVSASETFLELTQLRFSVSQGTALDVLEQRQQLASLKGQVPRVIRGVKEAEHALSVLVGETPGEHSQKIEIASEFPTLPETPKNIRPVDLLILRPDLRSVLYSLQANEYDVASAIAERFPRLAIGFNYDFSTSDLDDLFPNKTLGGNLTGLIPFIDGGRRRGIVDLEEAEVEELLARFNQRFLEAIQEVEDALTAEKYQQEILEALEEEYKASQDALQESKTRYLNGIGSYLRVLIALQTKQRAERNLVTERKNLLLIRSRLYLALGGKVLVPIPTEKEANVKN